jgi:hypothetical protein
MGVAMHGALALFFFCSLAAVFVTRYVLKLWNPVRIRFELVAMSFVRSLAHSVMVQQILKPCVADVALKSPTQMYDNTYRRTPCLPG